MIPSTTLGLWRGSRARRSKRSPLELGSISGEATLCTVPHKFRAESVMQVGERRVLLDFSLPQGARQRHDVFARMVGDEETRRGLQFLRHSGLDCLGRNDVTFICRTDITP